MQNITLNYFNKSEKVLRCLSLKVEYVLNNESETSKIIVLKLKSYNKPVIDFNFGRYKDLFTLKEIFTSA